MSISNNTQNIHSLLINGAELAHTLALHSSRLDSLTASAADSADGDFSAEIFDARIDAFGNTHENTGNNIRSVQTYLNSRLNDKIHTLQSQIDTLADAVIKLTARVNILIEKSN